MIQEQGGYNQQNQRQQNNNQQNYNYDNSNYQNQQNQYSEQNANQCSQYDEQNNNIIDEEGLKYAMSKKKEQHRVEIRRKQNNEKFKMNRIQISYLQDQQKLKDYNENDKLDVRSLNINSSIDGFVSAYHANNFELVKFQVLCIRHCVTLEHKIKELEYSNRVIFEKGVMQFLITYLAPQYDEEYELQRDAIWIIAHFLSEQNLRHIFYIIEHVPLRTFFRLIEEGKQTVKEMALLSINNIIDENPIGVKTLVDNGIIEILRNLVINFLPNNQNLVQSTIRIIHALLSFSVQNEEQQIPIENLMPVIEAILPLFNYVDKDVCLSDDLFESIARITERDDEDIDQFYSSCNGIVLKTLYYIRDHQKSQSKYLISPLKIIQNLTCSYDHITESLIQFGLLDMISQLMKHKSNQIRRQVIFILSNVCASGKSVIDYLMQHRVVVIDTINVMETGEFILKKEATIAFCNILITISRKQIEEFLTDYNGIELLVDQMQYVDVDLNIKIVRALNSVIKLGGREKAAKLADSNNLKLKKQSEKLLASSYIVDEVEDEMEHQYQDDANALHEEDYNDNDEDEDDNDNDNDEESDNEGRQQEEQKQSR